MNSFMDILTRARDEAKASLKKNTENASVETDDEIHSNIPVEAENATDVKIEALGDAIVRQSREAMKKYKMLRLGSNSSKRIAKALDTNYVSHSQLLKAFKLQERYNPKRADWHIVGSYALLQLKQLLNKGIDLNTALNTPYEDKTNE